ncbi:hypothetical protein GCM10011510_08740 [Streptococcus himalayensis]|uniref:Uncharacterized protein n=1 Tax=Streptococcus himalayensis TaxID=1888195 RepID=A0A917EG49_9STRE|nr:hypothetical protein GCM10011510_08740 [Streptococcus himalayensis]
MPKFGIVPKVSIAAELSFGNDSYIAGNAAETACAKADNKEIESSEILNKEEFFFIVFSPSHY